MDFTEALEASTEAFTEAFTDDSTKAFVEVKLFSRKLSWKKNYFHGSFRGSKFACTEASVKVFTEAFTDVNLLIPKL